MLMILGFSLPWIHNSGFKKDFYNKAEESGKCPTITVVMFTNDIEIYIGTKTTEEWRAFQGVSDWEKLDGTKTITEAGEKEGVKETTKTTTCEKEIRYKLNGKYTIVKLNFWMMSNGLKYWSIDGIEGKADETIYSALFNGYNASYTIAVGQVEKIYFQTEDQKKKNEFTCPENVYLNEQNSLDYLITTNKDESNSSFGEIVDPPSQTEVEKSDKSKGCNIFGENTTKIIKWVYNLIKIGAPLLVVVLGILDFAKALLAGDDKGFKEAWQRFIKRLVAAVVVILLPVLITFILDISGVLKQYGIEGTGNEIYCIFK